MSSCRQWTVILYSVVYLAMIKVYRHTSQGGTIGCNMHTRSSVLLHCNTTQLQPAARDWLLTCVGGGWSRNEILYMNTYLFSESLDRGCGALADLQRALPADVLGKRALVSSCNAVLCHALRSTAHSTNRRSLKVITPRPPFRSRAHRCTHMRIIYWKCAQKYDIHGPIG